MPLILVDESAEATYRNAGNSLRQIALCSSYSFRTWMSQRKYSVHVVVNGSATKGNLKMMIFQVLIYLF